MPRIQRNGVQPRMLLETAQNIRAIEWQENTGQVDDSNL